MEILTLLKANIRHKKGSFSSIIILMIIISMSLTSFLSLQINCTQSIENAFNEVNTGDLMTGVLNNNLTDELLNSVKNSSMVERVDCYPAIEASDAECNGNTYSTGGSWFLMKLLDRYKLFNNDLTSFENETPKLKSGEIYITQGIMTSLDCNAGDTIKIKIYSTGEDCEFKIKGIIEEPMCGSSTIGWKNVFISDEDFDKIFENINATEDAKFVYMLHIYKSSDCTLTDKQFKRQLNIDTGIIDNSFASLTRSTSAYYTELFPNIVLSILMVFTLFLVVVVLIVMGHSISTGIEMDYVNLGVLKSLGFTKGKIRTTFILQYLIAQLIGAIVGIILAFPLIKSFGNIFQPITAILSENNISILNSMLIILAVLFVSGIFIFITTRKVGKISPVRAISGGRNEIYFDSRIKAPICKKILTTSLALRQFTSSKRRYIGTISIITILVFFMMTITIIGNVINSKSALENMGMICTECNISFKESVDDEVIEKIENAIGKYSEINKKYYLITKYFSVNGEETFCQIYKNTDAIVAIKGREPLYNNEIVITNILAEELNLKMGDKVTVSNEGKKSEYIISGFFQSLNDTGNTFAMSLEGAKKLGVDSIIYAGYSLSDTSKYKEIKETLNNDFGDILEADAAIDCIGLDETYEVAINVMKAVIYSFSVIFALVVVIMVCGKTFLQEKNDIGIYKAIGFTSRKLRLQFAVRFLIISLLGSAIGTLLCVLFSGHVISTLLHSMGITNFTITLTSFTVIAPASLICICFFVFAYAVSKKINKVEIRELITE